MEYLDIAQRCTAALFDGRDGNPKIEKLD